MVRTTYSKSSNTLGIVKIFLCFVESSFKSSFELHILYPDISIYSLCLLVPKSSVYSHLILPESASCLDGGTQLPEGQRLSILVSCNVGKLGVPTDSQGAWHSQESKYGWQQYLGCWVQQCPGL